MAQRASFSVNDRAPTPVSHTFAPRGGGGSLPVLFAEPSAITAGDRVFSISVKETKGVNGKRRVRLKLVNPTLVTEVVNGVSRYSVERVNYADVTFTFEGDSTDQERKDTVGMFANALAAANSVLNPTLTGAEEVW